MAGHKNKGAWHGIRPKSAAPNFKKGEKRTVEAAKKGGAARREKCLRYRTLKEAAEALRDVPSNNWPEMSNGVAAVFGVYKAASEGDAKALKVLAELQGELVEKLKVENVPILQDDIPRAEDPPKK